MHTKIGLRKNILARAKRLRSLVDFHEMNVEVNRRVIKHLRTRSGVWGAFMPLSSEPDLKSSFESLQNQIEFVFPKVQGQQIDFYRSNMGFQKNQFGVLEPKASDKIFASQLDGLLIPGIAFDLEGHRLGRGRAFYDRFLKRSHAEKVGVCFGFQAFKESLETESHDEIMDTLITNKFCLNLTRSRQQIDRSRFSERNFL